MEWQDIYRYILQTVHARQRQHMSECLLWYHRLNERRVAAKCNLSRQNRRLEFAALSWTIKRELPIPHHSYPMPEWCC